MQRSYNYTKVSDKMVAKFGWNVAGIYSKLCFRMKLSRKNPKKYYNDGYFIVYRINDLARDAHVGRNSAINALKKLEAVKYVAKVHTMFGQRIYLPKFNSALQSSKPSTAKVQKPNHESLKSKHSREQRLQNKELHSKSVYCSSVKAKSKRSKTKFPKFADVIKKYGQPLVQYSVVIYHRYCECHKVHNPLHFIIGVLKRWHRRGIKTVHDAMISEHDRHVIPNGPEIPIFTL